MRLAMALLACALLAPLAIAAPFDELGPPEPDARVLLSAAGNAWNGVSEARVQDGSALLWLPPGARMHAILVDGNATTGPWYARGDAAIEVLAPEGARRVSVDFDIRPGPLTLAHYIAPRSMSRVVLEVSPPEGMAVQSPDATFTNGTADLRDVAAGRIVTVRVVDADRIGELPVLLAVGIVSLVSLAGVVLWHRARPPVPRERRAQMGFMDHLAELQARLVPPIIVFAALNVFYFIAGLKRTKPFVTLVGDGTLATRAFDAIAERLVPAGVELVALRPVDAVLAQVQVALFLALVSVLPLLVYEIAAFVGPALEARERRVAMRVLPLVSVLFIAGAAFGFLVMAPLMIGTLYAYAPSVGARALLVVPDLIGFALLVVVAFALAFELPVLMFALSRLGVVQAQTWRRYFRHSLVAIVIIAGILTPDPSVVTQLIVAVPITTLYVVGMLAAAWAQRARDRAAAAA